MLHATLRSLLSRKLRLLLSGTAVVLAVTFMAGALVLNATLQRSFDNLFTGAYSGIDIQVSKRDGTIPQSTVDQLRAVLGVHYGRSSRGHYIREVVASGHG